MWSFQFYHLNCSKEDHCLLSNSLDTPEFTVRHIIFLSLTVISCFGIINNLLSVFIFSTKRLSKPVFRYSLVYSFNGFLVNLNDLIGLTIFCYFNEKYILTDGSDYVDSYEGVLIPFFINYPIWVALYSFSAYLVNIKKNHFIINI